MRLVKNSSPQKRTGKKYYTEIGVRLAKLEFATFFKARFSTLVEGSISKG
jgi:hypothetical protein